MTSVDFPDGGNEKDSSSSRSAFFWWRQVKLLQDHDLAEPNLHPTPRLRLFRELERLARFDNKALEEIRNKLINYRSGEFWVPTGGICKADMDIPPIITILLVGPARSGKSSLINLMYNVLSGSGLIPFPQTSAESCNNTTAESSNDTTAESSNDTTAESSNDTTAESSNDTRAESSNYTTKFLEEHNVLRSMRSGFCVYDTRGLDLNHMDAGLKEISSWMARGVRHYQPCSRPCDGEAATPPVGYELSSTGFTTRPVNCAVLVLNLADIINPLNRQDRAAMEAAKRLFDSLSNRKPNEKPILILTHGDLLPADERIRRRLEVCRKLGVPEGTGAYDIACVAEQGIPPDRSTAYALTEALYRALRQSDRNHLPKRSWFKRCFGRSCLRLPCLRTI